MHHPRPTPALLVLVALLSAALGLGSSPAVAAAPAVGTTTALVAPTGKAGLAAPFRATLRGDDAAALGGRALTLQRSSSSSWSTVATVRTGADGTATFSVVLPAGATTWRAVWAGDASYAGSTSPTATATGQVLASTLTLDGPTSVVDERSVTLTGRWLASDSSPVTGAAVAVQQRTGSTWTTRRTLRTSATGRWSLAVTPRTDTTWRVTGAAGSWWRGATSAAHTVDNRPAGTPVVLPAAAPRPTALPAQARATGAGANAVVTTVPAAVWRSMVGRSWHRGCPIGRSSLRLLRVNYWGFDGYRYRGEMVLATAVAGRAAAALRDMYAQQLPIRSMYRVDRFGWSSRVRGADDHASMRADNTSAFNCRWVVNKPGVMSPHARGRAIDLNTWENPYRSATGWVPNSWWSTRSHPRVAWRSASHPVVRIWRAHGFRWTYGTGDSQHVDGRTATVTVAGSFVG
ncbi:hypothetical protein ASG49_05540 [Marmoricola sp. Leaf446]|uniref:M15 family metallopeptidase n=1 Tax=Marmoricola sp. Leaf446 TaxID=1736379 RepID=UPI00070078B9|nr:M15 family metallopeptidase [Marmoricola sp. Leaf446]KQT94350.1 hypothetical protein ASG49_05540 [Marmoricola sp. Leaf446]